MHFLSHSVALQVAFSIKILQTLEFDLYLKRACVASKCLNHIVSEDILSAISHVTNTIAYMKNKVEEGNLDFKTLVDISLQYLEAAVPSMKAS